MEHGPGRESEKKRGSGKCQAPKELNGDFLSSCLPMNVRFKFNQSATNGPQRRNNVMVWFDKNPKRGLWKMAEAEMQVHGLGLFVVVVE